MDNPNCNNCIRRKHCFIKEFTVLSCEDYRPEITAAYEEKESNDADN
jgi:hypothetical protein